AVAAVRGGAPATGRVRRLALPALVAGGRRPAVRGDHTQPDPGPVPAGVPRRMARRLRRTGPLGRGGMTPVRRRPGDVRAGGRQVTVVGPSPPPRSPRAPVAASAG